MSEIALDRPDSLESADRTGLAVRAARSVKWSFLYNATPRLITPFSTMILAALLTPADFGLVAISTFIIALGRVIVEMGLGRSVIRQRTLVSEAASTAQWASLFMASALCLLLWIAAPSLATAYKNTVVTAVIRVSAFALPLASLAAIPTALLQRRLEFSRLFWVNTAFLVVTAISSVTLASLGIGAWAMIWGQIIGLSVSAGLAWRLSGWRPAALFDWHLLRSMLGFGSWVMGAGFLNWLFLYGGNAIAGLFLSVDELGVFSLGSTVAVLIPYFLVASLTDVAYPTFCAMQENPREVAQALTKVQALTGLVIFPVSLGISALAPAVVQLLYGSKWEGLGTVISILVVMPGMGYVWSLNEGAYQAAGRPDLWTKALGISMMFLIPLLWLTGPRGLLAVTLGRFAGAWILPLTNIIFCARVFRVGVREQLRSFGPALLISLGVFVGVTLLVRQVSPFNGMTGWLKMLAVGLLAGGAYVALIRLLQKRLWDVLLLNVRRVFS